MEHIYFFATESDNLNHFKITSSKVISDVTHTLEKKGLVFDLEDLGAWLVVRNGKG